MAAGVTDRLWTVEDIAAIVEAAELKPGGPCEGQIVRVVNGPFTGFRGEVKEVEKSQVYGRMTPVDVTPKQLNGWHEIQSEPLSNGAV